MNGQGLYTTWTVIASLINLSTVLKYVAGMDGEMEETVSGIALGTLLAIVLIYFVLENTVLDNYVRLLLTPYFGKTKTLVLTRRYEFNCFFQNFSCNLGQYWSPH